MGKLHERIVESIRDEKYLVGLHAAERLEERGIIEWQVVAGAESGKLLAERIDTQPNPSIELQITLEDGTDCKAVWSYLPVSNVAKLVTVHFFDR